MKGKHKIWNRTWKQTGSHQGYWNTALRLTESPIKNKKIKKKINAFLKFSSGTGQHKFPRKPWIPTKVGRGSTAANNRLIRAPAESKGSGKRGEAPACAWLRGVPRSPPCPTWATSSCCLASRSPVGIKTPPILFCHTKCFKATWKHCLQDQQPQEESLLPLTSSFKRANKTPEVNSLLCAHDLTQESFVCFYKWLISRHLRVCYPFWSRVLLTYFIIITYSQDAETEQPTERSFKPSDTSHFTQLIQSPDLPIQIMFKSLNGKRLSAHGCWYVKSLYKSQYHRSHENCEFWCQLWKYSIWFLSWRKKNCLKSVQVQEVYFCFISAAEISSVRPVNSASEPCYCSRCLRWCQRAFQVSFRRPTAPLFNFMPLLQAEQPTKWLCSSFSCECNKSNNWPHIINYLKLTLITYWGRGWHIYIYKTIYFPHPRGPY